MDVSGKTCLIAGGGCGLGTATAARLMAHRGWNLSGLQSVAGHPILHRKLAEISRRFIGKCCARQMGGVVD